MELHKLIIAISVLILASAITFAKTTDLSKNPDGLTCTVGKDSIDLKWNAPANNIKIYRIYLRDAKDAYRLIDQTTKLTYKLTGLKSSAEYYVKIVFVDSNGYESAPKDELKAVTRSFLPNPPERLTAEKIAAGNGIISVKLKWKIKNDLDENIKKYNIYYKDGDTFKQIASTAKTEYVMQNLDAAKSHYFIVRSVDDRSGGESTDNCKASVRRIAGYDISAQGFFVYPMGKLATLHTFGYGVLAHFTKENFLVERLYAGISTGYVAYQPKGDVQGSYMVPFLASAGYSFTFKHTLSVCPQLSLGYSYNHIVVKSNATGKSGSSFDPLILCGVRGQWLINERLYINADVSFGVTLESKTQYPFAGINFGGGMRI